MYRIDYICTFNARIFGTFSNMYIVNCHNITKKYGNLTVLRGVDLQVRDGQFISILGASGAGKSTLLNIIGTLDQADSGDLELFGISVTRMSRKDLCQIRNDKIGFIFQFHHLLPEFTALENTAMPAYIANLPFPEANQRAKKLLDRLGLNDRMHHKPGELSGGEQQRVALARALVNQPKLLLADEPTGNLDQTNAQQVLQLILELRKESGMTTLLITHDHSVAQLADLRIRMQDGKIIQHD